MPEGHLPVVSYLAVPVISRSGEVIGGLFFGHRQPGRFTERHESMVVGLAGQTAIAMDNARLYGEAQEAIRARDEFLSIASHELRTPVTGVKGAAQLLQRSRERGQLEDGRLEHLLSAIVESSDRLTALTDELLDISRIRTGRMPLHPEAADVGQLARKVARLCCERDDERTVEVDVTGPATAMVDVGRLEQVINNLIENALKYSPNGEPVHVCVSQAGEGLEILVADKGIGLPLGSHESVFEPFGRAENATRRELPGMGLGLYICRQIVAMHGGRIWAESPGEDQGATFRVWLPAISAQGETESMTK